MKKCQFSCRCKFLLNKRDLRADGLPLQPSALRPRLLGNRGGFSLNVAKIVVMTIILGVFGLFSMNSATPVSAASLTLSVPTDTLKLDLQPNNTFTKSSSNSVSVKTDAFAGYTLSIKAKNNNELVNGNNKISSITGNLTEDQYKASGNTNTWGYQPSKFSSLNNSAFLPGPTTSPSIIEKTSANNDTANSYNFAIGAKVDSNTPNGSYSNTFVFTATANAVSYNITYNLNQGSWTGTSPQTGNTINNTIKLSDIAPTRPGYDFLGWCNQQTSNESCGGTIYQTGKDYPLTSGSNTITLYAIWQAKKMQDFDCDSLSQGKTTTLIDIRDNNAYTVAKLNDGRCWMTQNLRIVGKPITSADSDVSSPYTIPNEQPSAFKDSSVNANHAYYGAGYEGLYTWYAATAGTGNSSISSGNASGSICPKGWKLPSSTEFTALTTAYGVQNDAAGSNTLRSAPLNFTYTGGINLNNGTLMNLNSEGWWWASTPSGSYNALALKIRSTLASPSTYNTRGYGVSVRCVKRKSITNLKYLQDFGDLNTEEKTWVLNSMESEKNYSLIDNRDNTSYTVAKLKDGKVWMTQNLRITGSSSFQSGHSATLTSSDSDVSSSFTIPTSDASRFKSSDVNNNAAYNSGNNEYGSLYTWFTATGGSGTSSLVNSESVASNSICSKGWKLPTGGPSGEIIKLINTYGITNDNASNLTKPPLSFVYSGSVENNTGKPDFQGQVGRYWSSSVYNNQQAHSFRIDSTSVNANGNHFRTYGHAIRCLVR